MLQTGKYTIEEQKAVDELKRKILPDLTPSLLQDETLYYRFLKARDFSVKDAEDLFRKHLVDRKLYEFEKTIDQYTPPENLRDYFPSSFLGYDKEGCVVRYIDGGQTDMKGLSSSFEIKQVIQFVLNYLEEDIKKLTEQTKKLGKPITQIVHILNLEKLSLYQATHKKGLEWTMEIVRFYQDNYPERNKAFYIINASFYFHLGFSIVKAVLADATLKKFHILGRSGWQEFLLDRIDADQLPKFLGGTRTDPDGDPRCSSFIVHGKKVPENLYRKNKSSLNQKPGTKQLTVPRSSDSELTFHICESDTDLEFEFETKSGDIAFSLSYKNSLDSKLEELIPKHKTDAFTGLYRCHKVGTYIILFDNSFSWIHSKEIYYRMRLVNPYERLTEINLN